MNNSMLELEQELDAQTRDISTRFQNERRPEPPGLDQALSNTYGSRHSNNVNIRSNRLNNNSSNIMPHKYASKSGGFVTGFDPLSKEEQAKRASRAQRFGAATQAEAPKNDPMDENGTSMDVDDGEWTRPDNLPETPPRTTTIRPEAVYLYGTDEMSTQDVLKYFEAYGPSHVEWIDDSSCNVVFLDQFSAKRALYFQLVDNNVSFGEDDDGNGDVEPTRPDEGVVNGVSAPTLIQGPKSKNRLQRAKNYIPVHQNQNQPVAKSNKGLFLRYATDMDRKEKGAATRSQYYAVHGRENDSIRSSRSSQANSYSNRNSMGSSRYGRRSRADDEEVWLRGRGITTFSRLRRKYEDGETLSPSPTRHRSWSRNRRLTGSRSRSRSSSRSRSLDRGSQSPEFSFRRERASRSPESRGRAHMDEYEQRGRRGDISSRLGNRVIDDTAVENRLNQYADDFLAELESSFSRREKAIPKTKLYSDFYERETLSEFPPESQTTSTGSGRSNRRDNRGDRGRHIDDSTTFAGASASAPGTRGRKDHRREREEALKALEARLGLPANEQLDEFGRSRRT
ncbi:hypothetical protein BCR41DRAFT_361689 [Lobosporangium transversale]|uniref:Nuclear cap-binding protein subunit 3 n=1 Tax=Lobosporangium transversale TaxID=64571 RepID=A0A1Y2GC53_9FUNG|nr:hypothetical protein BCR41DRAFT_361689 [Lobosporangium transversale]ORZ05496.1 hypothetical protein BCR41DRAFT_361689 [Lobosporangium transversale]|eukprot:XP_021877070.1 hypothetical protein BCR41DRAFT_361689 [Lobosporangium transversale]